MRFEPVAIVLSSAVLAGCATTSQRTLAETESPTAVRPQMRVVFKPECPISQAKPESALGALALSIGADLGGKLVGNVIDSIAENLGKSDEVTYTDSTRRLGFASVHKGQLNWNLNEGCMLVVIAREFDRKMNREELAAFAPLPGRTDAPSPTQVAKLVKDTGLSSPALFYFEATTVYDGDSKQGAKTAFAFKPEEFYYPGFISPSGMKYSSRRDVVFKVEMSTPGEATSFGGIDMKWQGVKTGEITSSAVMRRMLPWQSLPEGLDKISVEASDVAVPVYPVNVRVLFTETKNPHTFFKLLSKSLADHKDDAVTATEQSIIHAFSRQARADARMAAALDMDKKYKAYTDAYDTCVTAQSDYTASQAGGSARVQQELLAKAKNARRMLDSAELSAKVAYSHAGVGFDLLPPLPKL